ncbi:hypothetical protein AVEN_215369-1 [Araneus ventricosus]|uniref:Uncharacterized protein n=1 Tax=Araneus ventricosus TaxID=182803 RepID=A0A4Y2U450_ARAVE|nr:hypothetical protein AVEN_215369-1 [Araneus ventricosus]
MASRIDAPAKYELLMLFVFFKQKEILPQRVEYTVKTLRVTMLCVNGAGNLKTGEPPFMMKRDASLSQQKILLTSCLQLLEQYKCNVFDRPAYSPDLATSDFHL